MIALQRLRSLLLPEPSIPCHDLSDIVQQIVGSTRREKWLSAALLALIGGAAYALHAQAWLALFAMLLLPTWLASLLLGALQHEDAAWTMAWLLLGYCLLVFSALAWGGYYEWNMRWGLRGLTPLQFLSSAIAFGVLTLGLPLWNARRRAREGVMAELKHAALASQLQALQAQVEPHFLYNTLANARYLTRQDPQRATQMLDHLIAYLRSAMPDLRSSTSTLGREFELVGHYLELMAMRFGQRLQFSLDIDEALRPLPVPPLMLMTLVENAVRHGVEPHPGAVQVHVSASQSDQGLHLVVRDDGAGLHNKVLGSGVGLRNLRERLAALYGLQATFSLSALEGGAVEARIRLPLP